MPLYEYRCLKCGHVMEVLQKLSDPPLARCKKCSGKVEKLISRTSFALKGGGWFDQGYGSQSGSSKAAKSEASSPGSAEGGTKTAADTAKTDGKPAGTTGKGAAPAS